MASKLIPPCRAHYEQGLLKHESTQNVIKEHLFAILGRIISTEFILCTQEGWSLMGTN